MLPEDWQMIEIEIERIKSHLETGSKLLSEIQERDPDPVEMMALCSLLHGFYTGIENVCRSLSQSFGETKGSGRTSEGWHQQLLVSLRFPTDKRPALFSEELYFSLLEYLRFRHVFRHAYQQEIRWSRMKQITLNVQDTLERFVHELYCFRDKINK